MCAQSVLAASALVAQSYVDVVLPAPLTQVKPASLYFVSVGSKQIRKPKAAAGCMVG